MRTIGLVLTIALLFGATAHATSHEHGKGKAKGCSGYESASLPTPATQNAVCKDGQCTSANGQCTNGECRQASSTDSAPTCTSAGCQQQANTRTSFPKGNRQSRRGGGGCSSCGG